MNIVVNYDNMRECDHKAIDLFEKAIEKEANGLMSDAIVLYRQAFKLNDKVDILYRSHKVPPAIKKVEEDKGKNGGVRVDESKVKKINVDKLVASFHNIEARAPNENDMNDDNLTIKFANIGLDGHEEVVTKPISPLINLPQDIWVYILEILIVQEPEAWFKYSITCKRNSYLGFYDSNIWRQICRLIYSNQRYYENIQYLQMVESNETDETLPIPKDLTRILPQYDNSWKKLLFNRPFIKFLGCYISVINYYSEGRNPFSTSWNNPVRTITYYRYLRFYPDGTVLKVLTILEPTKVVPYLLKHNDSINPPPSETLSVVKHVNNGPIKDSHKIFKGTWSISTGGEVSIVIDNGPVPYYKYFYHFQIKNLATVYKFNKLSWIKYYAVRKKMFEDDDREGELDTFGLRNETSFKFLRVKSYTVHL